MNPEWESKALAIAIMRLGGEMTVGLDDLRKIGGRFDVQGKVEGETLSIRFIEEVRK